MAENLRQPETLARAAQIRDRCVQRCVRAFTLIELLVVMGIIVLVAAISIPAFRKILSGNNLVQGENLVSAYIGTAHALAMKRHEPVALVFYYEGGGSAKLGPINTQQMAMELAIPEPEANGSPLQSNVGDTVFVPYTSRHRVYLPSDVAAAPLNFTGGVNVVNQGANSAPGNCVAIVFNGNGQMIVRSGLYAETSGANPAYDSDLDWDFGAATDGIPNPQGNLNGGTSTPGIILYSISGLTAAENKGATSAAAQAIWIQEHADVLIVNSYTGGVLRQGPGGT